MTPQRPTTLKLFAQHCPAAVQHYEDGTPQDRRIFAAGTAAHEILFAVAEKRSRDDVITALTSAGRDGIDGEPPLPIDAVLEGADLADAWIEKVGVLGSRAARYEIGLAADRDWNPVRYDADDAYFRARLDVLDVLEEEDEDGYTFTGLLVDDYKTSWRAGEDWLTSVQAKAQAVLAALSWKRIGLDAPPDFIRRQVTNLRTQQTYSADLILDVEGTATLRIWRDELALAIDAANRLPRVASPGVGCVGCPYVLSCAPAREFIAAVNPFGTGDPADLPAAYAASKATTDALEVMVREVVGDGAVDTGAGVVGYQSQPRRQLREGAAERLWDLFGGDDYRGKTVSGYVRGMLKAMAPGVTSAEKVLKVLMPERSQAKERRALLETLIETKTESRFGIWKT